MALNYPVYDLRTGRRLTYGPTTGAYGDTYGNSIWTPGEFYHVLKWIKSKGFHIYANTAYGGVNYTAHSPKSWHYVRDANGNSLAADIGTYGDVNERNRIIYDLIPTLDRVGIGWHYARYGDVPNHWNHIHIDVSHWGRKGGTASNSYGFYTTYRKLNPYTALPLSGTTTTTTTTVKRIPKRIAAYYGTKGTLVKIVQKIAKTTVDGTYGAGTVKAVKALQTRLGVIADGNFGPRTAKAYLASVGDRSVGSTGFSVQLIQWIAGVTIDGSYGPATAKAVKEMQAWAGIANGTGSFGPVTREKCVR